MARAFGFPLDTLDIARHSSWVHMNQLCADRPKHPFSGMLERKFEEILNPVHEAYRRLTAGYEQELLRVGQFIFGGEL
jgi:hypothetical protein